MEQYIDLSDKNLHYVAGVTILAPIIWNVLARIEYHTRLLTKLACGNAQLGCYMLAVYIFSFSLFRDYLFDRALASQPVVLKEQYGTELMYVGYALQGIASLLVLGAYYQLGITGTYLGDYFGILMEDRITSFPFNVTDNPMYNGSTLWFIGHSLVKCSPAGLLLSLEIFIMYKIALMFEEPFTAMIYAKRDEERKSGKSSSPTTPSKRKSKKLD
ncbi:hypothetical protein C9374_012506 [Naegleria lovaniensis]|uniref:Phosphatidylethanolamine N-methyltransferase n=1 Tax=Naegleria lovaniensis TaxID=51637 RepID=A0AA88H230_NAELO|nr:uncharacterized protein C9374_012506 [Naegleria lovaniensis]KAG2392254.1 hypothetical protein C9374_012506 [Naegleria lovaniensis]